MKENKELIEKMREAIEGTTYGFGLKPKVGGISKAAQQCAEVATSHFAGKWNRVSDIFPENRTFVLTSNGSNRRVLYFKHNCFYDELDQIYGITHWMPLPEPPQE